MAGFQYLKDIQFPRFNSKKKIAAIIAGKITQEMVEKGIQYKNFVKPRLESLVLVEEALEHDFSLYSYFPSKYSFFTRIQADYLISYHKDDVEFIFIVRDKSSSCADAYLCCSAFMKDQRDYEENQRKRMILKKTRINLETGESKVIYRSDSFKEI